VAAYPPRAYAYVTVIGDGGGHLIISDQSGISNPSFLQSLLSKAHAPLVIGGRLLRSSVKRSSFVVMPFCPLLYLKEDPPPFVAFGLGSNTRLCHLRSGDDQDERLGILPGSYRPSPDQK